MVAINNAVNNATGASNSGVTNTFTITNPSNTASSQAQALITVGGATADDAFTTYTVSGVTSWSVGIDNSVTNDPYKISFGTALGTTDLVVFDSTAGTTTFSNTNLFLTQSSSGAGVFQNITNSSNTASSEADLGIIVGGASAGDPYTHYEIGTGTPTTSWATGISNANSDAFRIVSNTSASAKPSTGTVVAAWSVAGVPTFNGAKFIIQQVRTKQSTVASGTTIIPADNTIPQNTEGTQLYTLAITPTNSLNILVFDFSCYVTTTANAVATISLFQDSTANALFTTGESANGNVQSVGFTWYMAAGTTSSTTFAIRFGPSSAATMQINGFSSANFWGGTESAVLTITEIQV